VHDAHRGEPPLREHVRGEQLVDLGSLLIDRPSTIAAGCALPSPLINTSGSSAVRTTI